MLSDDGESPFVELDGPTRHRVLRYQDPLDFDETFIPLSLAGAAGRGGAGE